jgi:hypothetical protein
MAVDETGIGLYEDKVLKHYTATEFLYDYLRGKKTVGVIKEDPARAIFQTMSSTSRWSSVRNCSAASRERATSESR